MPGMDNFQPFVPRHTSAIVFVGTEANKHLSDIVNYWGRAFEQTFWDKIKILRVSSEPLPEMKIDDPHTRQMLEQHLWEYTGVNAQKPNTWLMPDAFIRMLRYDLTANGKIVLQIVCGHFQDPDIPAQLPARLAKSTIDGIGKGIVQPYFYVPLSNEESARAGQRELMEAIDPSGEFGSCGIMPYLFTEQASDSTMVTELQLWRAIALEMLVNADQHRIMQAGQVYSLGYTGLNADGNELKALCEHLVGEQLMKMHNTPASNADIFSLMLPGAEAPLSWDDTGIESAVQKWLQNTAEREMSKPGLRELKNLMILNGIGKAEDAPKLVSALRQFFTMNQPQLGFARLNGWAEKQAGEARSRLLSLINAPEYHGPVAELVLQALERLKTAEAPRNSFMPPKKKLFQKTEEYLLQNAGQAASNERGTVMNGIVRKLAGAMAAALRQLVEQMDRLQMQDDFGKVMPKKISMATVHQKLKEKYPVYSKGLEQKMAYHVSQRMTPEWIAGFGSIYGEDGGVREEVLTKLLEDGGEKLRREMGRTGQSFINALNEECVNQDKIRAFLSSYLVSGNRRMFSCIHDVANTRERDAVYFVDDDLWSSEWMQTFDAQAIMLNNDNIELLSWFTLQPDHTPAWLVQPETGLEQYFGAEKTADINPEDIKGFDTGNPASLRTPIRPRPLPQEDAQPAGTPPDQPELKLVPRTSGDGKNTLYYLRWAWPESERQGMLVSLINAQGKNMDMPIDAPQYNAAGGFDVTKLLAKGENRVRISMHSGRVYIDWTSMAGLKRTVQFHFVESGGKTELRVEAFPKRLMLTEKTATRRICYPVSPGTEAVCKYPGLTLQGELDLQTSPEDLYPEIELKKNVSL